jgi:hypothetical protein
MNVQAAHDDLGHPEHAHEQRRERNDRQSHQDGRIHAMTAPRETRSQGGSEQQRGRHSQDGKGNSSGRNGGPPLGL